MAEIWTKFAWVNIEAIKLKRNEMELAIVIGLLPLESRMQ
jgi:hypothetical protein